MKRIIKLAIGWFFIVLGVLGLFLPILQGILFLALGFSILATEYVWARNCLEWLRRRFPKSANAFDRAKDKSEAWIKRFGHRLKGEKT
jgi:uncharacterized membrane protein YbaN (DUF454 family)